MLINRTGNQPPFRLLLLSLACATAPVSAANFQWGEIDGQITSSLSIGASISTANPDPDLMRAASGDDGRRNYRSGDVFSKLFKGTHDLELRYADSGVFLRGTYWYDYALRDENQRFKNVEDAGRKNAAKSAGFELLDAFVYHNYSIGDQPGSVRLGRQVINWGESTFIRGGLNVINPANVAALRRPGSEIKEGLTPVNMLYGMQNLTDNLSAEAFYQLEWDQTVLDNCGTFFAGNDTLPDGCDGLFVGGDFSGNATARQALDPFGVNLDPQGIQIRRRGDNDARDSGQWGMAMRWFVPALDTELGFFAANYHSRLPYSSSIASPYLTNTDFAPQLCANLGLAGAACSGFLASDAGRNLAGVLRIGTSGYFADYPEDIRLYGLTFATTLRSGTALQGELSYRPNLPLQFNGTDLVQASLNNPDRSPLVASGAVNSVDNGASSGYRRKEVTQLQVSATHGFTRVMGADSMILIGEVGMTWVGGLEGRFGPRYGRNSTYGQGELRDNSICLANSQTPQHCNNKGFVTRHSWGYQARAVWNYLDVIAGIDLRPSLSWSHDVKGYGPNETSAFNEGSRAVSLGLNAAFNSTYNASVSYTNFMDGDYGVRADRDFVSVSFGITF